MIAIIGLVILIAALVVGLAGVLNNTGSTHHLGHPFTVLGYHVTGSTGRLFLYGIAVGMVALLGLILLLAGVRRSARAARTARRDLQQSRRETVAISRDRDDLIAQSEAGRDGAPNTPPTPSGGTRPGDPSTRVDPPPIDNGDDQ